MGDGGGGGGGSRGGGGGSEGIQRMIKVPKQKDSSIGIKSTKRGNHQSYSF